MKEMRAGETGFTSWPDVREAMANVTVIPATRNLHTGIRDDAVQSGRPPDTPASASDSEEQLTSYEAQMDYYTITSKSRLEWGIRGRLYGNKTRLFVTKDRNRILGKMHK